MEHLVTHAVTVFLSFLAIMNPLANTPIFLGLTSGDSPSTVKSVALRSLLLAFCIITLFCIAGKIIFELFGISLPAMQIAGGGIVMLIGYHMLQGNHSSLHQLSAEDNNKCREAQLGVAVSPLAMPILAGPGSIAAAMNFSAGGGMSNIIITVSSFALLCIITYIFFIFGGKLIKFIGAGGISVITRLMGLILTVIGMQMAIEGIKAVSKQF